MSGAVAWWYPSAPRPAERPRGHEKRPQDNLSRGRCVVLLDWVTLCCWRYSLPPAHRAPCALGRPARYIPASSGQRQRRQCGLSRRPLSGV